jgi:hypothetical protein
MAPPRLRGLLTSPRGRRGGRGRGWRVFAAAAVAATLALALTTLATTRHTHRRHAPFLTSATSLVDRDAGLTIILDARGQTATPATSVAANAQCWLARAGLLQPPASPVTLLAPSAPAAAIWNLRWSAHGGAPAVAGGPSTGRALATAALAAGRGFLLTRPDDVWLGDARRAAFAAAAGGVGTRPGVHVRGGCDVAVMVAAEGGGGNATSLLAVRPTRGGRAWWAAAVACEAAAARGGGGARRAGPGWGGGEGAAHPLISPACAADADAAVPGVVTCAADASLLAPSLARFDAAGPGARGLWPALVRAGVDATQADLADRGLWAMSTAGRGGCGPDPAAHLDQGRLAAALDPPAPPHPAAVRLRVRVLTMDRPASLARLLASLLAARYPPDAVIPLDIAIDTPGPDAPPASRAAHARTVELASALLWPHGPLTVDVAPTPRGLAAQWLGWRPVRGDEACLVLEDDVEVGRGWHGWAVPLLVEYWGAAAAAAAGAEGDGAAGPHPPPLPALDPRARLASISLSSQNKVVGEVGGGVQGYGGHGLAAFLGGSGDEQHSAHSAHSASPPPPPPPFYLAAQASSWAPILLPRPWAHFLDWYAAEGGRAALPGHPPPSSCLPGLASNQWWARAARPGGIWTATWHAFAARAGYVTLYAWPGARPQAINYKEPGEHFRKKGEAADGVLEEEGEGEGGGLHPHPPPFASLPVFDLHMRPLGPAGGPGGLRSLAARAAVGAFGNGSCAWVGMSAKEAAWLAGKEEAEG